MAQMTFSTPWVRSGSWTTFSHFSKMPFPRCIPIDKDHLVLVFSFFSMVIVSLARLEVPVAFAEYSSFSNY